jgi:hypothetical protein
MNSNKTMIRLLVAGLMCTTLSAAREKVDFIAARVGSNIICHSDLVEPQVLQKGAGRSLEECIMSNLLLDKAKEFRIPSQEQAIDKLLDEVLQRMNIPSKGRYDGSADKLLRGQGISLRRLREQLERDRMVGIVQHELTPREVLVTRNDIEDYCQENPEYRPEAYQISFALVESEICEAGDTVVDQEALVWRSLGEWTNKSSLGDEMVFITDLDIGEVSSVIEKKDHSQSIKVVYRLDAVRKPELLGIDERYDQVEHHLIEQKRAQKDREVRTRIREEAAVVVY